MNSFVDSNTSDDSMPEDTSPIPPFAVGRGRAIAAIIMLSIAVVIDGLMFAQLLGVDLSDYPSVQLVSEPVSNVSPAVITQPPVDSTTPQPPPEIPTSLKIQMWLMVTTSFVFLIWWHRAYQNLRVLGADQLSATPFWAVLWFVIPVANLVKPYFIAREIWQASDPSSSLTDRLAWTQNPITKMLPIWWFCWCASFILLQISRLQAESKTQPGEIEMPYYGLLPYSVLLHLIAGALLVVIIYLIDCRQLQRALKMIQAKRENLLTGT